jgi:hypothetical protein
VQDLPKFTQIGIFGLKIYHLATLTGDRRQHLLAETNFGGAQFKVETRESLIRYFSAEIFIQSYF